MGVLAYRVFKFSVLNGAEPSLPVVYSYLCFIKMRPPDRMDILTLFRLITQVNLSRNDF